ncbi:endonuclease/exonuclease/phosphatase family protein [Glaciecola sp. KUL10]|uniref:endonuclease/exonuclease/phosphatase family protein n=1 Tax=Glaciecola sp. (strain KUL10) TaxID=2161813 RepID=UPI000D78A347|nr:endonuclease/exonuclease/phosphatase family protein [Glaciecola sp. KUL10]GBL03519.1 endonuclease/exonuclease/phosphatase family protein [Glaciecola sp. KUL10]
MRISKLAFKASVVLSFAIFLGACDSLPKGEQSVTKTQTSVPLYRAGLVLPSDFEYSDKDTLKVISWNVEHFVDQYNDPYVDSRRENEPKNHMGDKRKDLVEALIQENADIVVLQEFESAKLLRDLAENELQGLGYRFFADAPSHSWYMNVVIMSRVPLGTMYSYGNANTPVLNWTDENGQAQSQNRLNTRMWSIDVFPSEDYSFLLSAVHLKAGRGERDIGMRLGQIAFLKHQFKRFLNEAPNRNIMLLGDFNALPNTAEHNAILAGDSKGMSFVDLLEDDEYTHTAADPKRRLDYIVMNQNMLPEIIEDSLRPVSYFDPERQDALADHLPVVVEFYITEK